MAQIEFCRVVIIECYAELGELSRVKITSTLPNVIKKLNEDIADPGSAITAWRIESSEGAPIAQSSNYEAKPDDDDDSDGWLIVYDFE